MKRKLMMMLGLALLMSSTPTIFAQTAAEKRTIRGRKAAETKTLSSMKHEAGAKSITAEKTDLPNNSAAGAPARTPKDGSKGSPSICAVEFDNWTNWIIKVWVDGEYEGTVGRMGDKTVYAVAGRTVVRARADFDDGSVVTWGPETFSCGANNTYTWRLDN